MENATIPPSLQDGILSGVKPGTSSLANFHCASSAGFPVLSSHALHDSPPFNALTI